MPLIVSAEEILRRAKEPAPYKGTLGGLSPREQQVVGLVRQGLTNQQIADRLGIKKPTVATNVARACEKLAVKGRKNL